MLLNQIISRMVASRYFVVLKNASTGGLAQIASMAAQLLIIRLSVEHLGARDFGVWMTINSVIAVLTISDFGLGGAILRLSAHRKDAYGNYDIHSMAMLSVRFLSFVGAVLLLLAILLTSWPFAQSWLGIVGNPDSEHVLTATRVLIAFFALNLVTQVSIPLRLGMQEGHINGLFQTCGHLGNLAFAVMAIQLGGSLALLSAAAIFGTTTANLLNLLTLLLRTKKNNFPAGSSLPLAKILKPSLPFFALGLIGVMSYNIDNLIIAAYLPIEEVTQNAVSQRVFNIPIIIVSLFYTGLWASYADAELTGEFKWIKTTYIRVVSISLPFAALTGFVLYASFDHVASLLTDDWVDFDAYLILYFALWVPITALSGATASLMNGLHILNHQLVIASIAMVLNVSFSIVLVGRVGVSGPILATLLSMMLTQPILVWICWMELKRREQLKPKAPR